MVAETEYIEFWLTCSSEATGASISAGCCGDYTQDESKDLKVIVDCILQDSFGDSFWENHDEFEEGIDIAERLSAINKHITFDQALRIVFGHFTFSLKKNGEPCPFPSEFDADECIYSMLDDG